jgi:hypothetical protein
MKIIATSHRPVQDRPYPKLMIDCSGDIFLMTKPRKGTVVFSPTNEAHVGVYSEDWYMDDLQDFEGELTLAND